MKLEEISRRSLLKRALALSAVSATPSFWTPARGRILPTSPLISANDRVNIMFIDVGQREGEIAKELYNTGLCNVVALCDVDMGALHTQEIINMFSKVVRFQDFRMMFDRMADKIGAVSVGVSDHSHFPIAIEAMVHGKHVYVEKPMVRTFQEIEIMMREAKKYGVVTQMGNQGHSEANYFQFEAWKEAGIIKDVTVIAAHMDNPHRWHGWDLNIRHVPMGKPVPEMMDWDIWIGVAQCHDYNHDYHLGQWRCWYDFGMGVLGDWGAHILDTAHEFLDLGLPTEINPLYLKDHNPFFFPMSPTLLFKFPEKGNMPAMDIIWYDGLDSVPAVPEGYGVSELGPNIPTVAGGKIQPAKLNPGKEIYSKELAFKGGPHESTLSIIPDEKAKEMESCLPEVPKSPSNHSANLLLSYTDKEKTRSPFSIADPLSQVFCLDILSQRLNHKLVFDRDTKQVTNDSEANKILCGLPPRKGWEQYYTI